MLWLGSRLVHKLFPGPVEAEAHTCCLSPLRLPVRSATGYRTSWYKTPRTKVLDKMTNSGNKS